MSWIIHINKIAEENAGVLQQVKNAACILTTFVQKVYSVIYLLLIYFRPMKTIKLDMQDRVSI